MDEQGALEILACRRLNVDVIDAVTGNGFLFVQREYHRVVLPIEEGFLLMSLDGASVVDLGMERSFFPASKTECLKLLFLPARSLVKQFPDTWFFFIQDPGLTLVRYSPAETQCYDQE